MKAPETTPSRIEPTEDGTALCIEWEDGKQCVYDPRFLRLRCPCAGCVDELTGERILSPAMIPQGVYPLEIHYVGRYALRFDWSDGHATGIYPFEYLRRLCGEAARGVEADSEA